MTGKEALESLRQEYYAENDEHIIVFNGDDERLDIIEKDLEILEEIRKTLKVEKEETINQNLYWLYIEKRPILITRKIYDLVKDELEEDGNNEKL